VPQTTRRPAAYSTPGFSKLALKSAKPNDKIASPVHAVLSVLNDQGITPANAELKQFGGMATAWARVDPQARVQAYIHTAFVDDATSAILQDLQVAIEVVNESLAVLQGWIPIDRIQAVAELPFVARIELPRYGTPNTGSIVTEGDSILRSDLVRQLGVDGNGVKIGVISDGANNRAAAIELGELPSDLAVFGSCAARAGDSASCLRPSTCNEGTAMLEIIHDIAPGADLAMGAVSTTLEFIERLTELVDIFQADVIVDDYGFFLEPYFADGPVAQAVANLLDRVVYVSAAGNSALGHYEADFQTVIVDGEDLHDFGGAAGSSSDATMDIVIEAGQFIVPIMQWNDRFGASANDYDLALINDAETDLLCPDCISVEFQTGTEDPVEGFCYFNPGPEAARGKLAIFRYAGAEKRMELFVLGGSPSEYNSAQGSIFGHAGVPGVLSTGAIRASDPSNDTIEPFSSQGPSRIDFPALEVRETPGVTAIDGVSVSGTGGFPSTFFGTSAAAPHVAGVVALVKQVIPNAPTQDLVAAVTSTAVDLGTPGSDRIFGAGRIDAFAAVTQIDSDDDGVSDIQDEFPFDPDETADIDDDGVGDNADSDDDNDGLSDTDEIAAGTDPRDEDTDGDAVPDGVEIEEGLDPLDGSDCPPWFCGGLSPQMIKAIVE
jgi:hypothetical protein